MISTGPMRSVSPGGATTVYAGEQVPILDWEDTTTGAEPLHVTDLGASAFSNAT